MPRREFIKDPNEVLDYLGDWSDWLNGASPQDTIDTSTWTVEAGIVKDSDQVSADSKAAKIWLSGGTAGQRYAITNEIVTAGGRTARETIYINVRTE